MWLLTPELLGLGERNRHSVRGVLEVVSYGILRAAMGRAGGRERGGYVLILPDVVDEMPGRLLLVE
jgi:hypothetical protein